MKIFVISSRFYISYMESLFFASRIIGSPGKNDSLVFSFKIILSVIMTNTAEPSPESFQ